MGNQSVKRTFASDNNSGVAPEVLKALEACNSGHCVGYGDDQWTRQATECLKNWLGRPCDVFFVYGGTGANVLSLAAATPSFGGVICAVSAHINVDECGAPEKFTGAKLLAVPTAIGKLEPSQLESLLHHMGDPHHSQPYVVSISQPTELGTVYTLEELASLRKWTKAKGLLLHIDGARISNAVASLGATSQEMFAAALPDLLSMGGTKNGLMFGEAVVSMNPDCSKRLFFLRKQGMQLHSKMRFISAQFNAMYGTDLWKQNAGHANKMARYLRESLKTVPGIELVYPAETNALFVKMPRALIEPLQEKHFFYVWDYDQSIVRWMTSFDTQEIDIDHFIHDLNLLMQSI